MLIQWSAKNKIQGWAIPEQTLNKEKREQKFTSLVIKWASLKSHNVPIVKDLPVLILGMKAAWLQQVQSYQKPQFTNKNIKEFFDKFIQRWKRTVFDPLICESKELKSRSEKAKSIFPYHDFLNQTLIYDFLNQTLIYAYI